MRMRFTGSCCTGAGIRGRTTKQWPGAAPNLNKRMCRAISGCFDLWKEMFRSGTKFGAWLDRNNDGQEL